MELRGASPFKGPAISGQYDRDYRRKDAEAWAAYYGVRFVEPRQLPQDHRLMARACCAADLQNAIRPYSEAMFEAVFVSSERIDTSACLTLASRLDLDVRRFELDMGSASVDDRVTTNARAALDQGAFGVPTFFVAGKMFWGNDRLVLLEHWLARHGAGERP